MNSIIEESKITSNIETDEYIQDIPTDNFEEREV